MRKILVVGAGLSMSIAPSGAAFAQEPSNNPGGWILPSDYPPAAIARDYQGTVEFRLTVSPEGMVSDCTVTGGSAPTRLKTLSCELITQRARFDPRTDANGDPVEGTWASAIRWALPDDAAASEMAGFLLPVPILYGPGAEVPSQGEMLIQLTISPEGEVAACEWTGMTGYFDQGISQEAVSVICDELSFAPALESETEARKLTIRVTVEENGAD